MIRILITMYWATRMEIHALISEYGAGRDFKLYWHHRERVRYCQSRIIGLRG